MNAGDLRTPLTFQNNANEDGTAGRDATGAPVADWTEYCVRRANVKGIRSSEFFDLLQRYPEAQYGIALRWDRIAAAITSRTRALNVSTTQTFTLLGPALDMDGKKQWLQIAAKESAV